MLWSAKRCAGHVPALVPASLTAISGGLVVDPTPTSRVSFSPFSRQGHIRGDKGRAQGTGLVTQNFCKFSESWCMGLHDFCSFGESLRF